MRRLVKYIPLLVAIVFSFFAGPNVFAQTGFSCQSDQECYEAGYTCDATTHTCTQTLSQPALDQTANTVCYVKSSKTCSQSEATCNEPNQKFPDMPQCEVYKQAQDTYEATANGTTNCRNGEDCVSLVNPLSTTDIRKIVGSTIQVLIGIIGSITFVIFLYGGVLWLTSAGNSEKIQKGLQAMLWAGIGIIVVFSSYAILTLILDALQASP